MSIHWKLDCAAGTITKCRWYVKTEKLRWLRQMQTSIVPHKSGKISLNRKKLKQVLRKIFSFVMPDLIWYIDILVCFLIHHFFPLLFMIVSLWNDIYHFIASRPYFPFGKKSFFFCLSNCKKIIVGRSQGKIVLTLCRLLVPGVFFLKVNTIDQDLEGKAWGCQSESSVSE